jgi:hypothetical protein
MCFIRLKYLSTHLFHLTGAAICRVQIEMSGYTADMQSVLRCGQCNKPFDKRESLDCHLTSLRDAYQSPDILNRRFLVESTLKRHIYYCRSRRTGSTARPRSCIPCARGKTGCDNSKPQCSRCIAKSIKCQYPVNTSRSTGIGTQRRYDASVEPEYTTATPSSVADSPSIDSSRETNNGGNMLLDGALDMPVPDFSNLGDNYIEWNDANMAFVDFLNSQTTQTTQTNKTYLSPSSSSLSPHSTPLTYQTTQGQPGAFSPDSSIPATPNSAVRSLVRRPKVQAGSQRISNLILHTLKSYPLMMLRHNSLPPFIHPSLVSSDVENPDMEPLTNCMSLVHMISSGVQGSRRLFWKNVRLECERLSHEVR